MRIIFEHIFYLFILLFLILLIVMIHFLSLKYTKRKAMKFANFEAIERILGTEIISKNLTVLWLRILLVALIFIALAGPSVTYTGPVTDFDFVLAIDASSSMMANDILPNRLEAAKDAATIFIDNLGGQAQVGVVSFSGISYIEQPLTLDMTKVKSAINEIQEKEIGGTDISNAVLSSVSLIEASEKPGAIILLTDGQINVGSVDEIANYVHNTVIYTIGFGTEEGGTFTEKAISRFDEDTLERIADMANGKYYRATSKEELINIYKEIVTLKKGEKTIPLDEIFLIAAAIVLFLEWVLINTKYRTIP